jgi:hypothetical protein
MGCREEILEAIRTILTRSRSKTFTIEQVVREMEQRGSKYAESSVRTHVAAKMCSNAPINHKPHYKDIVRVDRGVYDAEH